VLKVDDSSSPSLELRDGQEETRATLELSDDGSAMLRLFDKDGKVLWEAP
jgi:hypothetical protein